MAEIQKNACVGSKPDGFFELKVQRMEMKVPAPEGEVGRGSADGGVEWEETISTWRCHQARRLMTMDANGTTIDLLHPDAQELAEINRVIEAAVMAWDLPERVKRLALPSYRYSDIDAQILEFIVARDPRSGIVGVASWEPAKENDSPHGQKALLLHGLFVDSAFHRQGIGRALVGALLAQTAAAGSDGLLVKAQRDAVDFFSACGFLPLPVHDESRQYTHRLWRPVR